MRVALFHSAKTSEPQSGEIPWGSLERELLRHDRTPCHPCPGKGCPAKIQGRAWSPVEYAPGATRGNAGVLAVTAAVFDLDGVTDGRMAEIATAISGYCYVCHSTHSGRGFYRLVMPLSRPVLPREWPAFFSRAIAFFALPADPSCKDLARLYFFPSAPTGTPVVAERADGKPLDVDAILALPGPAVEEPEKISPPPEGPVDLDPIRASLRRVRKAGSAELARAILGGTPLAEPGNRDNAVNAAASLLATAPEAAPSKQAAMLALEPCIRAMDCTPEGADYWIAKAANSFERAAGRRAAADQRSREEEEALLGILGRTPSTKSSENITDDDWRKDLLLKTDDDGNPSGLQQCGANAHLILTHDPAWKGVLRFNEVSKQIDTFGGPLAAVAVSSLDVETANWLQRSKYKLFLKTVSVGEQLLAVARRQSYDPLADRLRASVWDGVPRLEHFFEVYFGAVGNPEHLRRIGPRWMISAAARALQPGCKVDTVLILEGAQGKFKSTALDLLFSPYFSDTKIDVNNKDSRMMAAMRWCCEMGELASFRKADNETLKSFFSTREDFFRPPYGRVLEAFPRRCVFVGSTNSDEYLSDPTGHRRFWPVRVGSVDLDRLRADRDQLWAEAVARFNAREPWWLDADEAQVAEIEAQERAQPRAGTDLILEWFLRLAPANRPLEIGAHDVAREALGFLTSQITDARRQEIGHSMRELKFVKFRARRGGVLVWLYRSPKALLEAPQSAVPSPILEVVR